VHSVKLVHALRQILEGKLVKLNYLCQKSGDDNDEESISRPSCIAFRVAGSPGIILIPIIQIALNYRHV